MALEWKVLDVAAGHYLLAIRVALCNHATEVTFQDWENVLNVAGENADRMGVAARCRTLPGSAFEVDFGTGYEIALVPNFLHHFDPATNVTLLKKVYAALKPGGLAAVIELDVLNDDRASPPGGVLFAMRMLSGDAYTLRELDGMLRDACFGPSEARSLGLAQQQLILARRS